VDLNDVGPAMARPSRQASTIAMIS